MHLLHVHLYWVSQFLHGFIISLIMVLVNITSQYLIYRILSVWEITCSNIETDGLAPKCYIIFAINKTATVS